MRTKTFWTLVCCAFLFFILFSSAIVLAGSKDTVTVAMHGDPLHMSSFKYKHTSALTTIYQMFQGMMKRDDKTGEWILGLAESLELMENGKDFRVRLRKGPKFSNGEPVTAHDVRFSWQQHLD
ncbi:MAG: hypothetical protein JRI95_11230, partial [Deltaproteobacteria bacterium]|nr:hypothetical protein [Deltaproteobacteria bacterium]